MIKRPSSLQSALLPTTIIESARLSLALGANVILASETFQHTGSFKFRGAYNVAVNVRQQHILAASSGNFGQALAYACGLLGKRCTIVMPTTSARVKVDAVQELGGTLDLVDVAKTSRKARIEALAREHPDAYVASAYDDPLVIEGNATLGVELANRGVSFDCVVAPLGGGGLTAGLITGLKSAGCSIPVMAVEPVLANDGARSLRAGRLIANETEPQTLADGVRTLSVGLHNWKVLEKGLADIIEVTEEQILRAVHLLFVLANLKAEPTGALPIAGLLADPTRFRGKNVCCIISGGNVDVDLFSRVLAAS